MRKSSIVSTLSTLLIAGLVSAGDEINFAVQNGHDMRKSINEEKVTLTSKSGWAPFYFTQVGIFTQTAFTLETNKPTRLLVTDAHCPGDAFAVYLNGTFLGQTFSVMENGCFSSSAYAETAYQDPRYATGHFLLPRGGRYEIHITPIKSPYGGGQGYVKVVEEESVCASGDFTVLTKPVVYDMASAQCAYHGLVKADISEHNFDAAARAVSKCIGLNSFVWFKKWFGEVYHSKIALSLDASVAPPTLKRELQYDTASLPVLCLPRI
jgi:hypothetical protein